MKVIGYALAATAIIAGPAQAGNGTGLVRSIIGTPAGVVLFTLDSHLNVPACSTSLNSFAFDVTTQDGKNKYALLLAAANARRIVAVVGSGSCWADRETVSYMTIYFP